MTTLPESTSTNTPDNFAFTLECLKQGLNLFITGVAGSGKSYLLRQLKEHFGDSLHLTATTGISAININGVTIHSWAKLGIGNVSASYIAAKITKDEATLNKIKYCKYLAIDEISMLSDKMLSLLHQVLVLVRGNTKPFGGIQLLLFGDFLQLPPVLQKDERLCIGSAIWMLAQIRTVLLTTNYRQQGDVKFFETLKQIRKGENLADCYKTLQSRVGLKYPIDITKLVATRDKAAEINEAFLAQLKTPEKHFKATYTGEDEALKQYTKAYADIDRLVFKVGAKVMLTYNLNLKQGLINGLLGVIISFTEQGYPLVQFENGHTTEIKPFKWTVNASTEDGGEAEEVFSCSQIPLQLAWATTIHKSQGCTFSELHVDLSRCFAPGQAYVALSRVKSLEGLYLEPFNASVIKVDKDMKAFYEYLETQYASKS